MSSSGLYIYMFEYMYICLKRRAVGINLPRHRFFLVSVCLKANAEMVPKTPSCYCMLLM